LKVIYSTGLLGQSVCLSVHLHIAKAMCSCFTRFCMLAVCGLARSFADDSAMYYVLPVL